VWDVVKIKPEKEQLNKKRGLEFFENFEKNGIPMLVSKLRAVS